MAVAFENFLTSIGETFDIHHIIPQAFYNNPNVANFLTNNVGLAVNGSSNLIALPDTQLGAIISGMAPHTGGHLRSYTQPIAGLIQQSADQFSGLSIADQAAMRQAFISLQTEMAIALATQQLLPNTLIGLGASPSGINSYLQAQVASNAINAAFYANSANVQTIQQLINNSSSASPNQAGGGSSQFTAADPGAYNGPLSTPQADPSPQLPGFSYPDTPDMSSEGYSMPQTGDMSKEGYTTPETPDTSLEGYATPEAPGVSNVSLSVGDAALSGDANDLSSAAGYGASATNAATDAAAAQAAQSAVEGQIAAQSMDASTAAALGANDLNSAAGYGVATANAAADATAAQGAMDAQAAEQSADASAAAVEGANGLSTAAASGLAAGAAAADAAVAQAAQAAADEQATAQAQASAAIAGTEAEAGVAQATAPNAAADPSTDAVAGVAAALASMDGFNSPSAEPATDMTAAPSADVNATPSADAGGWTAMQYGEAVAGVALGAAVGVAAVAAAPEVGAALAAAAAWGALTSAASADDLSVSQTAVSNDDAAAAQATQAAADEQTAAQDQASVNANAAADQNTEAATDTAAAAQSQAGADAAQAAAAAASGAAAAAAAADAAAAAQAAADDAAAAQADAANTDDNSLGNADASTASDANQQQNSDSNTDGSLDSSSADNSDSGMGDNTGAGGDGGNSNGDGGDGGGNGDGGGDGGGDGSPVILDLSGKGLKVTTLQASTTYFDMTGDHEVNHTAWAAAGEGVLAIDLNGTPTITQANEIEFTKLDPTAKTDLQALEDLFDVNHSGQLDASDPVWSELRIIVTNADGTTTTETMAQAGVTSIKLTATGAGETFTDGSKIAGTTTFTRSNGTTGSVGDVTFAYDSNDVVETSSTSVNASGQTVRVITQSNQAGIALSRTTVTSWTDAAGAHTNYAYDTNADGIPTGYMTDLVTTSGTTTTEVQTNYGADNTIPISRTIIVMSTDAAGDITTTTSINSNGSGINDTAAPNGIGTLTQAEVYVQYAAGGTSNTTTNYNPNGSISGSVAVVTSANGLTKTTSRDYVGAATAGSETYQSVVTDVITRNGSSGAIQTETVTKSGSDGTKLGQTATSYSGATAALTINGQSTSQDTETIVTQTDSTGTGVYNTTATATTVTNSVTGTNVTNTEVSANRTLISQAMQQTSADGMTITSSDDSTGLTNSSGAAIYLSTEVDATVLNGDGSKSETITQTWNSGALKSKEIKTTSADGKTVSTSIDTNGDGVVNQSLSEAPDANGDEIATVNSYSHSGAEISQAITTTSSNSLSKVTQVTVVGSGIGAIIHSDVITTGASSSKMETVEDLSANGALVDETQTTTSASGLSVLTLEDHYAAGTVAAPVFDNTVDDEIAIANGVSTETVTVWANAQNATHNASGAVLLSTETVVTSADHNTVTSTRQGAGTGIVQTTVAQRNSDGSATTIATTTATNVSSGASFAAAKSDTITAGNGLTTWTLSDEYGLGYYNSLTTDQTSIGTNGSRTEVIATSLANIAYTAAPTGASSAAPAAGTILDTKTIATSGNGLSVLTTNASIDSATSSGSVTYSTDQESTLNSDGSETTVTTNWFGAQNTGHTASGAAFLSATKTQVSGTGLSKVTWSDLNGAVGTSSSDYAYDEKSTDVTAYVQNSSGQYTGATTETVSTYAEAGTSGANNVVDTLVSVTTTQTSADKMTVTETIDRNGSGRTDEQITNTLLTNGNHSVSTINYSTNGTVLNQTTDTNSANGLVETKQTNVAGNGIGTVTTTNTTTPDAAGNKTVTTTTTSGGGALLNEVTTFTSASGLSVLKQTDGNGLVNNTGSAIFLATSDDETSIVSGVKTETISSWNGAQNLAHSAAGVTLLASETITTSANGQQVTTSVDSDGRGNTDQLRVRQQNEDGSVTDTTTNFGYNTQTGVAFVLSGVKTVTSANGLSSTTSYDDNGAASASSETYDRIVNDVKTLNPSSSVSLQEVITTSSNNGTTLKRVTKTASADGLTETIQTDDDGNGTVDTTETDVTSYAATGTTLLKQVFAGNGALLAANSVTTNPSGLVVTTQDDHLGLETSAGTAAYLTTTVDSTVLNGDGSKTETLTTTWNSGTLASQSVISTSTDGKTVTTTEDTNGDGYVNKTISDVVGADGSTTETVTNDSLNGTEISQTVAVTSANGLSKRLQSTIVGSGIGAITHSDISTLDASGNKSDSVEDLSANGTLLDETVTWISASGMSVLRQSDTLGAVSSAGAAVFNETVDDETVIANGVRTETTSNWWGAQNLAHNATGAVLLSTKTVATSANDQAVTTTNVNAATGITQTSLAQHNADGSETTILTSIGTNLSTNAAITLSKSETVVSGNGMMTVALSDEAGVGYYNFLVTDQKSIGVNGSEIEVKTTDLANIGYTSAPMTATSSGAVGTRVLDTKTTVTSGNSLSVLTIDAKLDANASAGTVSFTKDQESALNLDGSETTITTNWYGTQNTAHSATGTLLLNVTKQQIAYNGLSTTTWEDQSGAVWASSTDYEYNLKVTDLTTYAQNSSGQYTGSKTEVVSTFGESGTVGEGNVSDKLIEQMTTQTSSDGATVIVSKDINGDGVFDQQDTSSLQLNGTLVVSNADLSTTGAIADEAVTTTSANGLSRSTVYSSTPAGSSTLTAYETLTDVKTLGADNSSTSTATATNGSGATLFTSSITTSDNGLAVTTNQTEGSIVHQVTDLTSYDVNGTRTETVQNLYGGALHDATTTITSASGNSVEVDRYLTGTGKISWKNLTIQKADGSTTETIIDYLTDGATLADETIITRSSDGAGQHVLTKRDTTGATSSGSPVFDQIYAETIALDGSGNNVDTLVITNASGTVTNETIDTTSADGLTDTVNYYNGSPSSSTLYLAKNTVATYGSDGSTSISTNMTNGSGTLLNRTLKTTSASGLSVTTSWDPTGTGTGYNQVETSSKAYNADGSVTIVSVAKVGGIEISEESVITSGNGLTKITLSDPQGTGAYTLKTYDARSVNADGSTSELIQHFNVSGNPTGSGTLMDGTMSTTSADGLTTTIQRDGTGSGVYTQTETIVNMVDGSAVDTIADMSASGALLDKTTTSLSADGLVKTTVFDLNGDGTADRRAVDTKFVNGNGSVKETMVETNADGSLYEETITTTSADGKTITENLDTTGATDGNGNAIFNETKVTTIDQDGASITTDTKKGAGGNTYVETTTTSADRKMTAIGYSDTYTGQYTEKYSQTVAENIDGSETVTTTDWKMSLTASSQAGSSYNDTYVVTELQSTGTITQDGKVQTTNSTSLSSASFTETDASAGAYLNNGVPTSTAMTAQSTSIETKTNEVTGAIVDNLITENNSGTVTGNTTTTSSPYSNTTTTVNNLTGADTITVDGNSENLNYNVSNMTIDVIGNNNTITSNGTGNTIVVYGSNDGLNVNGSQSSAKLYGSSDTATLNVQNISLALDGSNETATLNGQYESVALNGTSSSATLEGANETVTGTGTNSSVTLGGSNESGTLYGINETVKMNSSSQSMTLWGSNEGATINGTNSSVILDGTNEGVTINGSSDSATSNGSSDTLTLNSTGETAIVNGSTSSITISGGGASDSATINGVSESASLNAGGASVTLNGVNDSATLNTSGETATLNGASEGVTLNANSDSATLKAGSETATLNNTNESVTVGGNNSTVNLYSSSDGAVVNGQYTTVNVNGTNDNATLNQTGDTATMNGSSSAVTANGTNQVVTVNGNNNNAYLYGSNNKAVVNTAGNYAHAYGTNETIVCNGAGDPVILDLRGTGLSIDPLSSSSQTTETGAEGTVAKTAWASDGEGILVLATTDASGSSEYIADFTSLVSGAKTDLDAIKALFDTNGDGKLDAGDSAFKDFRLIVDGQTKTLAETGVTSIDLNGTTANITYSDGSKFNETTTFTRADGTVGEAGNAILASQTETSTGTIGTTESNISPASNVVPLPTVAPSSGGVSGDAASAAILPFSALQGLISAMGAYAPAAGSSLSQASDPGLSQATVASPSSVLQQKHA